MSDTIRTTEEEIRRIVKQEVQKKAKAKKPKKQNQIDEVMGLTEIVAMQDPTAPPPKFDLYDRVVVVGGHPDYPIKGEITSINVWDAEYGRHRYKVREDDGGTRTFDEPSLQLEGLNEQASPTSGHWKVKRVETSPRSTIYVIGWNEYTNEEFRWHLSVIDSDEYDWSQAEFADGNAKKAWEYLMQKSGKQTGEPDRPMNRHDAMSAAKGLMQGELAGFKVGKVEQEVDDEDHVYWSAPIFDDGEHVGDLSFPDWYPDGYSVHWIGEGKRLVREQASPGISEDEFWAIVAELNWGSDGNYKRVKQELISDLEEWIPLMGR